MSSKSWLEPQIELAANYGFGSKDLKKRTDLVENVKMTLNNSLQPTSVAC